MAEVLDKRAIFEIRLLVEAPIEEVESLADRVGDLVCQENHGDPTTRCRRRWFVVSRQLDAEEAEEWNEVLNE